MYNLEIYIAGERLELFDDENVSLKSSVQNIKDISKVFTDFTQSFTVPASRNNNKIFQHWYNADISNGFSSVNLVDAEIKLNGTSYKDGKIKLNSTKLADNKAQHYKITFFGKLINLNDLFGDDLLSALDLTAYSHDYDSTNVKAGLQEGILDGNIIYPLISSSRNWDYNGSDTTNEIKYDNNNNFLGINWNELKPAIKINRIIEAIESKYGVEFSNDFFNNATNGIDELFIWLNGTQSGNIGANSLDVYLDSGDTTHFDLPTNIGVFPTYTSNNSNDKIYFEHVIRIQVPPAYENTPYNLKIYNDEEVVYESDVTQSPEVFFNNVSFGFYVYHFLTTESSGGDETFNLRIELSSPSEFEFDTLWAQLKKSSLPDENFYTNGSSQVVSDELTVANNLPNIKVSDFFSSLIKMFNLVVDPITQTSFRLIPLDDWYFDGNDLDVSEYIDVESKTVTNPTLYKNIDFKYEKATDNSGDKFFELNKRTYGNLEYETSVDGSNLDIQLKFQNLLMERLSDTTTGDLTSIHVGSSFDRDLKEVLLSPILFFNRGRTDTNDVIGFIDENTISTPINYYLNVGQESSTEIGLSEYSLNFGGDLSSWNYASSTNSLFNVFWKDYISDLYDPRRREYTFTADFPLKIINSIKLNDLITINKKNFIINDLNVNLNTGEVRLNLLNYIGNALIYKKLNTLVATLNGTSSLTAIAQQFNKITMSALLIGDSSTTFVASQIGVVLANALLNGDSSLQAIISENSQALNSDVITTTISITNATLTDSGHIQEGKVIGISNGANAINYTINGELTASFVLIGTGAVTFVQGAGRTLVGADLILNGIVGSTASLVSFGTTDYLQINNL